ncbi:MAG: hypothetical protein KAI73_02395, partial [Rhodospirillaceae bacterium]|nr:hypothetical protein [Rhodospirillaceae bacterium]
MMLPFGALALSANLAVFAAFAFAIWLAGTRLSLLAVADIFVVRAALTTLPRRPTTILEGMLLIVMMTVILVIISLGEVILIP